MELNKKCVSWLQDAHAIKKHTAEALQRYHDESKGYPVLRTKLKEHLAQTLRHKESIETCLTSFGASHSRMETVVAGILGAGQNAVSRMLGDALLTNAAATCALEQLETATLTAIAAAAGKVGNHDVAQACEKMLNEDSAMAAWMLELIPSLTREYLAGLA